MVVAIFKVLKFINFIVFSFVTRYIEHYCQALHILYMYIIYVIYFYLRKQLYLLLLFQFNASRSLYPWGAKGQQLHLLFFRHKEFGRCFVNNYSVLVWLDLKVSGNLLLHTVGG